MASGDMVRPVPVDQAGEQVRDQLGDVLHVVAQRGDDDRAREAGQQVGQLRRGLAGRRPHRRDDPGPVGAATRGSGSSSSVSAASCAAGIRSTSVSTSVPLLDASSSATSAAQSGPASSAVEHAQPRRGHPELVGGAGHGLPAGPRLALQDEPLPRQQVAVHRPAALGPRRAGADRGRQRRGRRGHGPDLPGGRRADQLDVEHAADDPARRSPSAGCAPAPSGRSAGRPAAGAGAPRPAPRPPPPAAAPGRPGRAARGPGRSSSAGRRRGRTPDRGGAGRPPGSR